MGAGVSITFPTVWRTSWEMAGRRSGGPSGAGPACLQRTPRRRSRLPERERSGHTLQTRALLHEAYLRLADQRPLNTENRRDFIGVAARLMRQILVDYARSHRGAQRGPDRKVAALAVPQMLRADVVAFEDALTDLTQVDQQQSRIVELRFFGVSFSWKR
jgi:RNA polymerase sigma factor (TIGR02999 family)